MFQTPSKGWSSRTNAPFTPRKKGLFEDGQWLCDCKPRKPGLYLQVKKEGANKGKHFYTCESRKCDFFLWEHDAQPRERDALLRHNCRSENGIVARVQARGEPPAEPAFAPRSVPPPPRQRLFNGDGGLGNQQNGTAHAPGTATGSSSLTFQKHQQQQQQPPPQPTTPSTKKPPAKRKRGGFLEDDSDEEQDLFGDSDLDDPDTERQLALAADAAAASSSGSTGRPSAKRARFAGAVPAALADDDDDDEDEPMPRDPGRLLFPPQAQAQARDRGGNGDAMAGTTTTPTPNRKTDAFLLPTTPSTAATTTSTTTMMPTPATTPGAAAAAAVDYPLITDAVMALLARQPLAADVRLGVRLALEGYERQVRGLARGRAATRAALERQERRAAELQARVVALENARRMDRARLREVSEGLVRLSQEDKDEESEGEGVGGY